VAQNWRNARTLGLRVDLTSMQKSGNPSLRPDIREDAVARA
jgi:hypothetical protein